MRMYSDTYSKKLLQEALDPVELVELQKQVSPHDPQYCDVFCEPRPDRSAKERVPHLGALYEMTAATCSIEPCAKTPTVADLRGLARKQLSLHHQLCKTASDPSLPVPPQWILSPGLPLGALAAVSAIAAHGWPTGFFRSCALLEQWIVALSELPRTTETRLLRLMGPSEMRQAAMAELAGLAEDDPTRKPLVVILNEMVYIAVRKAESTLELSATERDQMTELRREFEEFQRQLRSEGAARGKAEALLAVLSARGVSVNEVVREKIFACTDLSMLNQWVVVAATAASPEEVLTVAA